MKIKEISLFHFRNTEGHKISGFQFAFLKAFRFRQVSKNKQTTVKRIPASAGASQQDSEEDQQDEIPYPRIENLSEIVN